MTRMKKFAILLISAAVMAPMLIAPMSPCAIAQNTGSNDSIATVLRLNTLQNQKESLQREIKTQDAKRNKQIAGVSAETLEEINDRQDSICLELRSQLTDVILEIKELSPNVLSPQLINRYNTLIHKTDK